MCVFGVGEGVNGVVCPRPPFRNDIVTRRHLFFIFFFFYFFFFFSFFFLRGFVRPSVRLLVRPLVRLLVHWSVRGHESKRAKMSVLDGFCVGGGGRGYGWGLDAPTHPSATIL